MNESRRLVDRCSKSTTSRHLSVPQSCSGEEAKLGIYKALKWLQLHCFRHWLTLSRAPPVLKILLADPSSQNHIQKNQNKKKTCFSSCMRKRLKPPSCFPPPLHHPSSSAGQACPSSLCSCVCEAKAAETHSV